MDADFRSHQFRKQTGGIGQRRKTEENPGILSDPETVLLIGSGKNHRRKDILLVHVQHGSGIGCGFNGLVAAFPCGLQPQDGRYRQLIVPAE